MSGKADPHKEFQSPLLRGQQSKVRAIKKVQRICWCDAIQAAMDISLLQGYVSVARISFSYKVETAGIAHPEEEEDH